MATTYDGLFENMVEITKMHARGLIAEDKVERLEKTNAALIDILRIIVANARIQPDASMNGTTDVYAVPLDDIEKARSLIARAERLP